MIYLRSSYGVPRRVVETATAAAAPAKRTRRRRRATTTMPMPTTSVAAGSAVDDQGEGEGEDGEEYDDGRPWGMWVAKRSMSKATYAGLLDQMVAGGQPSGMTFAENVRKECEEEASLPPDVLRRVKQTGLVSYRYATAKGLSTKVLATYDLELPHGLLPICADGEWTSSASCPSPRCSGPSRGAAALEAQLGHGRRGLCDSPRLRRLRRPNYMEIAHLLRTGGLA